MKDLLKVTRSGIKNKKKIINLLNSVYISDECAYISIKYRWYLNQHAELLTFITDYVDMTQARKRSKLNVYYNRFI